MVEIPLHLQTPSMPGWVRFMGKPQDTVKVEQPLGEVKPAVTWSMPIFSFRRGYSSGEEHRLETRTEDYNTAKNTLDPTDPVAHARVMAVYEELRDMYAKPPRFTITLFGRSLAVSAPEKSAPDAVDVQCVSPFLPSSGVSPDQSPALGD